MKIKYLDLLFASKFSKNSAKFLVVILELFHFFWRGNKFQLSLALFKIMLVKSSKNR